MPDSPTGSLRRRSSLQHLWDVFLVEVLVTQEEAMAMSDQEFDKILKERVEDQKLAERLRGMRDSLQMAADAELRRHNPEQAETYGGPA